MLPLPSILASKSRLGPLLAWPCTGLDWRGYDPKGYWPDHCRVTHHKGTKDTKGSCCDGTFDIVGAAIEVHRQLGPGLLESAYERCLSRELSLRGIEFQRQVSLPIEYRGLHLDCGYRLDLVVNRSVIVEVKATRKILPIHRAQVLTYLKLTNLRLGLLFNFNVEILRTGLYRIING
jgi:GxxExxY protein